uniref:SET domain-containing protein n=1 Tax=Stegastes partitus TaxID=144197 RepID=A0A3B5AKE8_9TELE
MKKRDQKMTPEQDALQYIVACRDKPFLEKRFIDSFKGKGVFTHKTIKPSSFVVEYRGKMICEKDKRPEKRHGDTLKGFLYEFSWKGAQWCVDASKEDGSLGRLVNDNHTSPNCEVRKVACEGKPHLCLFAVEEISPGEEITYDYGDASYPWRSTEDCDGSSTSNTGFYVASSTPKNKRDDDSAASNSEESCSDDDDELPGPSRGSDSFTNVKTGLDFRGSSPFTSLDSSHDMAGTPQQRGDISPIRHDEESALSSNDHESDEDYEPSESELKRSCRAKVKSKDMSFAVKNYCYVCGKGVKKIARHLRGHADEEPDIAAAFALHKRSAERRRLLDKLRNRGNFRHNQEVLKSNTGVLKLRRRPKAEAVNTTKFVHCLYCKGMLKRSEIWRHVNRCVKKMAASACGKAADLSESPLAESGVSQNLPSGVWKILSAMKQDEVAFVVQNDPLLIQMAQSLSEEYGNDPSMHDCIRQKLREMGRLLLALHEKSIFSFENVIKPHNFYKVVNAVKNLAGFNVEEQTYKNPSLALKLGNSLKTFVDVLVSGAVSNKKIVKDTNAFMNLCEKMWTELVSQTAVASLRRRKANSPSTIPFTRDVQAFYTYLEKASASATESMTVNESPQVYGALCRVTLAQASILNKCAPEVSKMTLKAFQERDDTTRVLSKHFIRINILSKTGQNVAVLLTSQLVNALTLLVSKRHACDVHEENLFLFAKPECVSTSHYHGGNCIRAFSSLCRAKHPEHLRSVHLHKHTARIFQILNLENDELDHLGKLLGQGILADRDYYRLPEAAVELAKIAKLLLAMEKGSLERFKGNSLEEIEIEGMCPV